MPQYQSLIMIALLVVGFYFLILRPQKKRQQAVQKTMRELEPGTRVLLNSGIFATIVTVGDRQTVVEIAPGVELTVLKQAIARVVTDTDEDSPFTEDDELDELDEIDEPHDLDSQRLDQPTFERPSAPSTPSTPTSATSDAYQPSSTYSTPDNGSTSTGTEPTNPTTR